MKPLDFISVSELSKLIKNKEVSPTELLDNTLKKIEKLDPILNSFAFLDIEGAKSLAKESEKRMMSNSLLSELDGIPTSIKDLIAQKTQTFESISVGSISLSDSNGDVSRTSITPSIILKPLRPLISRGMSSNTWWRAN